MNKQKYKITFRNKSEYAATLSEAKKTRTRMRGQHDESCTIFIWNKKLGADGGYEPHA